jgi:PAS domain-containing protein
VALFDDVTERVQSQLALEQSQECFLAMLDGIDVTIYVTDMETSEILFMNKHMRKAFGGDFTGQSCWKVFRQEVGPCAHCPRGRLLDERGNPAGAYIWEDLNPVTGKWYINSDRAIDMADSVNQKIRVLSHLLWGWC